MGKNYSNIKASPYAQVANNFYSANRAYIDSSMTREAQARQSYRYISPTVASWYNLPPDTPSMGNRLVGAIKSGGIGNFARGMVASTGAYNKVGQQQNKASDQQVELLKSINKLWKENKISDKSYKKMTASIAANIGESQKAVSEELNTIRDVTNKRKVAFGAAETALTPFMFSPTGAAGATKLSGAIVRSRVLPKVNLPRTVMQQSSLGAAQGAMAAGGADEFTRSELAKKMALGGAVGAVASGAPSLIAKGSDKLIKSTGKALWNPVSKTKVGKSITEAGIKINEKVGSRMARLKHEFKGHIDEQGNDAREMLTVYNNRIHSAQASADEFLSKDSGWQKIKSIVPKNAEEARNIALEASRYRDEIIKAQKAGLPAPVFRGDPRAKQMFDAINESKDNFVKLIHKKGLITDDMANKWIGDKDYIRVQRQIDDTLKKNYGGSGAGNMSSTQFQQRLKGSEADVIDALSAHRDWVNTGFTDMAKNDMAVYVARELERMGKASKLVDADRTLMRREMGKLLNDTSEGKKFAEKMTKKYSKEIRKIQSQITQLNTKGRKELSKELNKTLKETPNTEGVLDSNKIMSDILSLDNKEIRKLKRMIGNREPKLVAALDEFSKYKKDLEAFGTLRGNAYGEILANKDLATTNKNIISNFNKGVKEIYEVDQKLADSIKTLGNQDFGPLYSAAMAPNRLVRVSATALNPVFIVKNYLTDQMNSAVASEAILKTHSPVNMIRSLVNAFRVNVGKSPLGYNGVPDSVVDELVKANQSTIYASLLRNEGKVWDQVAKDFKLSRGGLERGYGAYRKTEDLFGTTEIATRLQNGVGIYRDAVKKGMNQEQALNKALSAARANSADFLDYGQWAKGMRLINVYLPASIAGSRTLINAFIKRPTATGAKVIGTMMAPAAISTYNNLSDPDRAAFYASLSDYERDNNFIWVFGTKDGGMHALTIPMPPGLKHFTKPVRNLVEAQYFDNRQSFAETAKNILLDPFNPLGSNVGEAISSVSPQGFKQALELSTNRNMFFGSDIIPEGMRGEAKEDQVYSSTGQTYRDIGKMFGISPLHIKYMAQSVAPGAGESLIGNLDAVRNVFDKNAIVDKRSTSGQFKSKFTADRGSNISEQFFTAYDDAISTQKSYSKKINQAVEAGDMEKALNLANESNNKVEHKLAKFERVYYKYATSEEQAKFDKLKKGVYISTKDSALRKRAKK